MTIRVLPYDLSTERAIEEIVFSYAKCKAHPQGIAYAPEFKIKLEEGTQLILSELALTVKKVSAQALIEYVDENLNDIVDGIDNVTDSKNELLRRLRGVFFGAKPPSTFKKPILGTQLAAQRTWLGPLQATDIPESLQKFAKPLAEQVQAADEAVKEKATAAQESRDFKTVGARIKFIDALNALRKNTFQALDALTGPNTELPKDFANRFFIKRSTTYEATESLEDEQTRLQARAETLQEELSTINIRLSQIEVERSKQATEEASRLALEEEMAAAERHLATLKAKRAKL